VIQQARKNYVFKTWIIALMAFYSSPSKIHICILNFTKIRWKITEILGWKVFAETPCIFQLNIQGYSRVIMSPTQLKMQPTIHFRKKLDILISIASFFRKCSVDCIFNSVVGFIITRELPCTSDNEPDDIENATHNTFSKLTWI
jgi:hypothetical protein